MAKPQATYTTIPLSPQKPFLSKNQNLLLPPKIQNQNPKLTIDPSSLPLRAHLTLHPTNQGKEPGTMMKKPEFLTACKADQRSHFKSKVFFLRLY